MQLFNLSNAAYTFAVCR